MRFAFVAPVLCLGFAACGCSGGGSSISSGDLPAPQHGGQMLQLPGGKGFAELFVERSTVVKGAGAGTSRLLAYFYQTDGTSALAPPPSAVKIRLGAEGGKDVTLSSQTTPAGQFASERAQYPDVLRGTLEFTLAGESVQAPFSFR